MKNILILLILITTTCFSQKHVVGQHKKFKRTIYNILNIPTTANQAEETTYFSTYLLPIAQKADIQTALNTYGSVRLERGDYSGVNIVMNSNQKLYGHPALSKVTGVTIAAGSSGVVLQDLLPTTVTFQAGGVISNCTLKSLKYAALKATNAQLENNTIINHSGVIHFDCSVSGYFRNNKIIKHQAQTNVINLVMKGNSITPSYGNVSLHTNFLAPGGDTSELDNLQSATFVGIDGEGWNLDGTSTKAMLYARNIGDLKITDLAGGNAYSPVKTAAFDIDATNAYFLNRMVTVSSDVISPRTNMFMVRSLTGDYSRSAGTVTGFDLVSNKEPNRTIVYNGVTQTSALTDPTEAISVILGTQYTPWSRPTWEVLPDPLGANWRVQRVGKPDSTTYIQNLIDTNRIAELPEGVFYISSTLLLPISNDAIAVYGITGQGTGKTVICGLTDTFPLISLVGHPQLSHFTLSNLTLQGGSEGIYASQDYGSLYMSYQNMRFVVFRDQTYGIRLKQTKGFDNNFLENLGFVNCNIGFFQDPLLPYDNNIDTSSYTDKTMFYKNQFINCNTPVSMIATRAGNLNAWVDCKFNGGEIALNLGGQNAPIVANCDFTNYTGSSVIKSNTIFLYNSDFYNNSITSSTIRAVVTNVEGCNFLDSSRMFEVIPSNSSYNTIVNSTVTGRVDTPRTGNTSAFGTYVNSILLSNPERSKLLVNENNDSPQVIINTTPNPYPQFLVTQ
jgi:hypothetical protein